MELHDVSYGIEYVAQPLLLFFSFENRILWFMYRKYDLAHLKLVFEFSISKVWKSVGYGVSMYWIRHIEDFLEMLEQRVLIGSGMGVGIVVHDEVLHKMISMIENCVKELLLKARPSLTGGMEDGNFGHIVVTHPRIS
ncbi:hypothetical protein Tco_0264621 [Tanacetum coccineum]